jgi:hypothetical protein
MNFPVFNQNDLSIEDNATDVPAAFVSFIRFKDKTGVSELYKVP